MRVDSTFEFEKRRNIPVRYDRDLMGATIKAMKRVAEIQSSRERRFFENRMKGNAAREKAARAVEIAKNINLVKPDAVRRLEERNMVEKVKEKESISAMDYE